VEESSLEFLRFNYRNLHASLWESHKIAWTITGIFIPVTLAIQGYLAKEYLLSTTRHSIGELVAVFLISVLPLLIWRLMIWMLEHYNSQRLRSLRGIEEFFVKEFIRKQKEERCGYLFPPELVKQYEGFEYTRKIRKIKVSWGMIYTFIVVLITLVNIILIIIYYKFVLTKVIENVNSG